MEVEIREYKESDKVGCMEAFKSNVPLFFTNEEINDFDSFLDRIIQQEVLKDLPKTTYYYVVISDGKVIGSGGFGFYNGAKDISLAWGLIHNDFHKKGLGEKLLSYRLEQIKVLFPKELLILDTSQHSFTFFEKFGFVTKKITLDFYTEGMHRYDMVFEKH